MTLTRRRAFQSRFLTAHPVGRCKLLCHRHSARAAVERQHPPRTCGDSPANRRAASERHYRKHEGAIQCAKSRSSAASFARPVSSAAVRARPVRPIYNRGYMAACSGEPRRAHVAAWSLQCGGHDDAGWSADSTAARVNCRAASNQGGDLPHPAGALCRSRERCFIVGMVACRSVVGDNRRMAETNKKLPAAEACFTDGRRCRPLSISLRRPTP